MYTKIWDAACSRGGNVPGKASGHRFMGVMASVQQIDKSSANLQPEKHNS